MLFQHLFWFYSHPAVYIMILPGMGVISEVITCFARKRVFGYNFIAFSSLAIAVLGFLVWGHHMFVSSQSVYAGMVFSILSMIVAIPVGDQGVQLDRHPVQGIGSRSRRRCCTRSGFIGLFTIGGLTGLFLATLGIDVHVHDTYFVVAHFHYIMVGGAMMGYLGGLHFWWPKISGKMYPEWWGRLSAIIIFLGFNLTFFPQFLLGYLGMPRRYHVYPPEFQVLNVMSTAGASILGVGYLIPLVYLIWSHALREGRPGQPVGRNGAGVADAVAAAAGELPRDPGRDRGGVRLRQAHRGGARPWLTPIRCCSTTSWISSSRRRRPASGCGCSSSPRCSSSAGCSRPTSCIAPCIPAPGRRASHELDVVLGGINTGVLICSSLTMALAVHAAQLGRRNGIVLFLLLTMLLGGLFLGIKAYEYHHKWVEGFVPGPYFHFPGPFGRQVQLFFAMYFAMTGMHALHMIIGMGLMVWLVREAWRGRFSASYFTPVENFGLYWHFVDIIWIFLFPLLYLLGRH